MKKKLIAILLATTTTLSLTGCSLSINGKQIIGENSNEITIKESEETEQKSESDSEQSGKETVESEENLESEIETETKENPEKTENETNSISISELYAISKDEFTNSLSDAGYLLEDEVDASVMDAFTSAMNSEYINEASFAMSADYNIMLLYFNVYDPEDSISSNSVGEIMYAGIKSQLSDLGETAEKDGVRYSIGTEDGASYALYNVENVVVLAAVNTDDTGIAQTIATELLSGKSVSINSIDESSTESAETNNATAHTIKSSGTIYADNLNFVIDENGKYYVKIDSDYIYFSARVDVSSINIDQYDNLLFMDYEKEYDGINYYFDITYGCAYVDVDDQNEIAEYFDTCGITEYNAYDIDGTTIYIGQKEASADDNSVYMYALENVGMDYFLEVQATCYNFDGGNYISSGDLAQSFIIAP